MNIFSGKQKLANGFVLLTVIFMDLLAGMEFDLFVPSFPDLQSHFGLATFWVEALLSINFIGYCLSLFFVGKLADRYGRKKIILLGLITFSIGSILCLSGKFFGFLLAGRFLQNVGIAAPAILSFLIIADSYPLKKQQFLLAMLNGSMNTAAAISPVIGSFINLYFHWQGNFIALLILGLITLIMTIFFVPNYKIYAPKDTVDFRGYLPIFQSKPLMLVILNLVFLFTPYWIFIGMSPLLYMKNLGVSLTHFGYYQGILALVFAFGSVFFGLIMHNYKQKKMLSVSSIIYLISFISVGIVTFSDSHNPLFITLAFIPFIISQIIPSTLLFPLCLNFISQAKGRVAAVLQGTRLLFSALSLQIAGYFYQGTFRNIGIIVSIIIFMVITFHFFVMRNHALMSSLNDAEF